VLEQQVWGGVGKGDEKSRSSRVWIEAHVEEGSWVEPAGVHRSRNQGKIASLPSWKRPYEGYGLFPLQRERSELQEAGNRGLTELPTAGVRHGLSFDLHFRIEDGLEGQSTSKAASRVLGAIWLWIAFGGLGARTSRGFGSLTLRESVSGLSDAERSRFEILRKASDGKDLFRACSDLSRALPIDDGSKYPRLGGARIVLGPIASNVDSAHQTLLEELRRFRQGEGVGRTRKPGGGVGKSAWPEAQLIRVLARQSSETGGAPRAAFGMPLNMTFKDEEELNSRIVPKRAGGRWPSPVRFSVLASGDRAYRAVALIFAQRPGQAGAEEVSVHRRNAKDPATVRRAGAASSPISELLAAAKPPNDAVAAFTDYLKSKGFEIFHL
jgi:CRISPR-associated protein Cmr1